MAAGPRSVEAAVLLVSALAVALATACANGESDRSSDGAAADTTIGRVGVRLPGAVWSVDGDTLELSGESVLLVYHWLPLPDYPECGDDLVLLDSLHHLGLPVIPVQFDQTSRHIGQYQLQGIGSRIEVCVADQGLSLAAYGNDGSLPVALLYTRDGRCFVERGHGALFRVLSDCPVFDMDSLTSLAAPPAPEPPYSPSDSSDSGSDSLPEGEEDASLLPQ